MDWFGLGLSKRRVPWVSSTAIYKTREGVFPFQTAQIGMKI